MVIIRGSTVCLLAFSLAENANALSTPIGRSSMVIAPPQTRVAPPPPPSPQADGNAMPPPYGDVAMNSQMEVTEGRIAGSYTPAPGGNWWDQAGNPGTYQSINTSVGTFSTYTEAQRRSYPPSMNNNVAPEPPRIPGRHNQQATGNWWDRAGPIQTHQSINTSAGTFTTYTETNREPVSFNQNYNQGPNGNWWDRAGNPGTHESINTSAGFTTYTDAQERRSRSLEPAIVGTNRDPEPMRVAGSYNQQATSSWWDRPGSFNSHESIRGSSGTFQTHTDMIRERTQYS